MSNFDERLIAAQDKLAAELDDGIAAASSAVAGKGAETCLDCNKPIPVARRVVAPWAVRCIECQELLEAEKYHR